MAVNFFNRYFNITRSKDKVCSTCGGTGHVNVFHPRARVGVEALW